MTAPCKRIMSLNDPEKKMSKSHKDEQSRILINDSTEDIRAKIRLAKTDSISGVSYDPVKRPGVSNLLSIMSYLDREQRSCEELAARFKELNMPQFKDEVCKSIELGLDEIRTSYNLLVRPVLEDHLNIVAHHGAKAANAEAHRTLAQVREAIGLPCPWNYSAELT